MVSEVARRDECKYKQINDCDVAAVSLNAMRCIHCTLHLSNDVKTNDWMNERLTGWMYITKLRAKLASSRQLTG